jgi:hypothetical protein
VVVKIELALRTYVRTNARAGDCFVAALLATVGEVGFARPFFRAEAISFQVGMFE